MGDPERYPLMVTEERLDRLFGAARPGWSPALSPANNRTDDDEEDPN